MSPDTLGRLQWGNTPNTEDGNDHEAWGHLSLLCFHSQPLSCASANFLLLPDQGFPEASSPGRFLHLETSLFNPFFNLSVCTESQPPKVTLGTIYTEVSMTDGSDGRGPGSSHGLTLQSQLRKLRPTSHAQLEPHPVSDLPLTTHSSRDIFPTCLVYPPTETISGVERNMLSWGMHLVQAVQVQGSQ